MTTYLNPFAIENFSGADNGTFIKKDSNDLAFSPYTQNREIYALPNSNIWSMNNGQETFTYGDRSQDITINVAGTTDSSKQGIVHVLRINNTDNTEHQITISVDNTYTLSPHAANSNQSMTYTVSGNSYIEFQGMLYEKNENVVINVTPSAYLIQKQANWAETNSGSTQYILNKPSLSTVATTGSYNDLLNLPSLFSGDYNDLTNKPVIPDAQIQSDWLQSDNTAKDYIKNKPLNLTDFNNDLTPVTVDIVPNSDGTAVTITITDSNGTRSSYLPLSGGGGSITQLPANWTESDSSSVQYILNKPTLATVATSGSYTDLSNKPTIPAAQVNADWNAVSGVAQILNKPVIPVVPSDVSAFTNDAGYLTSADLSGKRDIISPVSAGDYVYIATRAANDEITQTQYELIASVTNSPNPVKSSAIYSALALKADFDVTVTDVRFDTTSQAIQQKKGSSDYTDVVSITTLANYLDIPAAQIQSDWNQTDTSALDYIKNKPSLATVATSGNYNDLTNKPTIPTAVQSDWAETDTTDPSYIENKPSLSSVATSGDYSDLSNTPDIKEYNDYLTFEFTGSGTLTLNKVGSPSSIELEYSTDGGETWTTWEPNGSGHRTLSVAINTQYSFRGDNKTQNTFNNTSYYKFSFNSPQASIYCSGNLMSIVDKSCKQTSLNSKPYRFAYLFDGMANLKSAPEIKVTDIGGAEGVFRGTFRGTGITEPPVFHLINMANYCLASTFENCSFLVKTADIKVTTAASFCCNATYKGCTSLKNAGIIRFTIFASYCCKDMFNGDTALIKAADVIGTTASTDCCNGMYAGCTSLVIPPKIVFGTYSSGCCSQIFKGDTSLIRTPLIDKSSFGDSTVWMQAFYNCSSLKEMQITATSWNNPSSSNGDTYQWMTNVSATGTVYCDEGLIIPSSSANTIPAGWDIVRVVDTSIEHFDFANEDRCGIVRASAEYDNTVHTVDVAVNPENGKLYANGLDEPYIVWIIHNSGNSTYNCSATATELHENLCIKERKPLFYFKGTPDSIELYVPLVVEQYEGEYDSSSSGHSWGEIHLIQIYNLAQFDFTLTWEYDSEHIANSYVTVVYGGLKLIQSDWNQANVTEIDYIKNKPTIPDAVSGTNDGTNWTSLTIGSTTKAIPTEYPSPYTPNPIVFGSSTVGYSIIFNYNPTAATYNPLQEKHFILEVNDSTTSSSSPFIVELSVTNVSQTYGVRHRIIVKNCTSTNLYVKFIDNTTGITTLISDSYYLSTKQVTIVAAPDNGCICAEVIYYPQHVYINSKGYK